MRTIDAVRRSGITIRADQTIQDAARTMESTGVGALAVVDEERLVGIVTDRDLVRRALARGLDATARIDGVMTMPVETVEADADLHETVRAFEPLGVRRLAVTDRGRFVGVLSVDDLVMDAVSDLTALLHPVTAEVLFSHHDAPVPTMVEPSDA